MLEEKDIKLIEKMISESITSILDRNQLTKNEDSTQDENFQMETDLPRETIQRMKAYEKHLSQRDGEKRKAKVIFAMSGGKASKGSQTTRITLPITWVRDMGISADAREVTITFKDNKIIIEKPE